MNYTVKNYRELASGAYEGTLWLGKVKLADFDDDGRGGQARIHWTDRSHSEPFVAWAHDTLPAGHWAVVAGYDIDEEVALSFVIDVTQNDKSSRKGQLVRAKSAVIGDPLRTFPYRMVWTVPAGLLPELRTDLDAEYGPGLVLEGWNTITKDWDTLTA